MRRCSRSNSKSKSNFKPVDGKIWCRVWFAITRLTYCLSDANVELTLLGKDFLYRECGEGALQGLYRGVYIMVMPSSDHIGPGYLNQLNSQPEPPCCQPRMTVGRQPSKQAIRRVFYIFSAGMEGQASFRGQTTNLFSL
jgi:hypothetical protein